MDQRSLEQNYNESLAMSLLEILCSSRSSCSSRVLCLRRLWWKFFGALKACFRRALLICDLLMFLKAFELDSRKLLDLGRWFGWFCFEWSPILGLKFLKFLEASGLDSSRAFSLLNLGPLNLGPLECLRKASIYRSLGVGERHVAEPDWWHMS